MLPIGIGLEGDEHPPEMTLPRLATCSLNTVFSGFPVEFGPCYLLNPIEMGHVFPGIFCPPSEKPLTMTETCLSFTPKEPFPEFLLHLSGKLVTLQHPSDAGSSGIPSLATPGKSAPDLPLSFACLYPATYAVAHVPKVSLQTWVVLWPTAKVCGTQEVLCGCLSFK